MSMERPDRAYMRTLTIYLDKRVHREFKKFCVDKELNMSDLIRQLVEAKLRDEHSSVMVEIDQERQRRD